MRARVLNVGSALGTLLPRRLWSGAAEDGDYYDDNDDI